MDCLEWETFYITDCLSRNGQKEENLKGVKYNKKDLRWLIIIIIIIIIISKKCVSDKCGEISICKKNKIFICFEIYFRYSLIYIAISLLAADLCILRNSTLHWKRSLIFECTRDEWDNFNACFI